ncbi:MAG: hypothetical protein ABJA89_07280 [Lapillicoccus sp.]
MTGPDVWARERALARTTVGWGVTSVAVGLAAATSSDPWRRAAGWQTAGWGAVDLAIAVVAGRLQDRRMRRLPDPYAVEALDRERVALRRVLAVNTVADLGYVALGVALARDPRPRVAGAGMAIVVQGAFLALHDGSHAAGARS